MTTVLDGDWTTVSTRLPFRTSWYAEPLAEPGDAGLAAEADQVKAGDSRERPRLLGELDCDREALRLGVRRVLAALDQLLRHLDARHVLVHEAQRRGRARQTEGRRAHCSFSPFATASVRNVSSCSGRKETCSCRKRAPARAFFRARSTR